MTVLLLLLLAAVHGTQLPPAEPDGQCDGIDFGHQQMWDCALNVADKHFAGNNDGKVSIHEMRVIYDHFLSWFAKSLFRAAIGRLEDSVSECSGAAADSEVTFRSMMDTKDRCFPQQSHRCRLKTYICDPAAIELNKPVY